MFVLFPLEGLCNRMRAVASALSLTDKLSVPLSVYWLKDARLGSRFDQLFKPIPGVEIIEIDRTPFLFRDSKVRNLYFTGALRRIKGINFYDNAVIQKKKKNGFDFLKFGKYENVAIKTYCSFFENRGFYEFFRPICFLQEEIEKTTNNFDKSTIGLHIRRTDSIQSIIKSPLYLFEKKVSRVLKLDRKTKFYLATDCEKTKIRMLEKFGENIVTRDSSFERDSTIGIQDALVDLYCLSKTSKIFGSYYSSFSHVASQISGIESVLLYKKEEKFYAAR